jgi:hypothetical protein
VKGAENVMQHLRRGLENSLRRYRMDATNITLSQIPKHSPGKMTTRRGRPVPQRRSQHSKHYGSLQDNLLKNIARSQADYYVYNAGDAFWIRFLDEGLKPRDGRYRGIWRRVTQEVIDKTKTSFPEGLRAAGLEVRAT